jgi:hypothetical protein
VPFFLVLSHVFDLSSFISCISLQFLYSLTYFHTYVFFVPLCLPFVVDLFLKIRKLPLQFIKFPARKSQGQESEALGAGEWSVSRTGRFACEIKNSLCLLTRGCLHLLVLSPHVYFFFHKCSRPPLVFAKFSVYSVPLANYSQRTLQVRAFALSIPYYKVVQI